MAIVQINDPNRRGTGHRFGEELGLGLQELAGQKVQQLARQGKSERNFHALLAQGFPEQQALAYSQLPDETLRDFFRENLLRAGTGATGQPEQNLTPYQQLLAGMNAGPQPQTPQSPQSQMSQLSQLGQLIQQQQSGQQVQPQQLAAIQQLLSGGAPALPAGQQPMGAQIFSGQVGPQGQMPGNPVIPVAQGGTGLAQPQTPMNIGTLQPGQQLQLSPQNQQQFLPPGQTGQTPQQAGQGGQAGPATPQLATQLVSPNTAALTSAQQLQNSNDPLAMLFGNPTVGARPAERARVAIAAQKELNRKEYQTARLEAKKIDQDLSKQKFEHQQEVLERPYYEEILNDHKTSMTTLNDLDRLTNLINSGEIVNPTEDHMYRYAAKTLMIPMKDLRGASTAEYEKIVAGFIKNAKNWFGSRVTNFDLESFLKTLPDLTLDHESKMRLIGSMRAAALAQKIRYEAFRDLMSLNNGKLPPYAKMKVEEMISPILDSLAESFISGNLAPKLSDEAIASMKRNQWMRSIKGGLTALGYGLGAIAATVKAVGNVTGALAGLPVPTVGPAVPGNLVPPTL